MSPPESVQPALSVSVINKPVSGKGWDAFFNKKETYHNLKKSDSYRDRKMVLMVSFNKNLKDPESDKLK